MNSGPAATLVSAGSLPVTLVPSVFTPLPQSGRHWASLPCWGPYLAIPKPQAASRAAVVEPIIGTVSRLSLPVRMFCSTNLSASEPSGRAAVPLS